MWLPTGAVQTHQKSLHWKLTLGEKALAEPGNKTCISIVSGLPVWCSANSPSPPISMEMSPYPLEPWRSLHCHWKLILGGKALGEPGNKTCISIVPGLPGWCSANLPMAYQFPWKWALTLLNHERVCAESWLWDLGEKALGKQGNKTCISIAPGLPVWCSARLTSLPISMELSPYPLQRPPLF